MSPHHDKTRVQVFVIILSGLLRYLLSFLYLLIRVSDSSARNHKEFADSVGDYPWGVRQKGKYFRFHHFTRHSLNWMVRVLDCVQQL